MSLHVLSVKPGKRYHHSFMDDLESFFWLIFWCAATHLDGSSTAEAAQRQIDYMDQYDLVLLAEWKWSKLAQCHMNSGEVMKLLLRSFGNQWASNHLFIKIIISLGNFFFEYYDKPKDLQVNPVDMFSHVVSVITKELNRAQ